MERQVASEWVLIISGLIAHADGILEHEECERLLSMLDEEEVDAVFRSSSAAPSASKTTYALSVTWKKSLGALTVQSASTLSEMAAMSCARTGRRIGLCWRPVRTASATSPQSTQTIRAPLWQWMRT